MTALEVRIARPEDRPHLLRFMYALQMIECELEANRMPADEGAEPHLDHILETVKETGGAALIGLYQGVPVGFLLCSLERDVGSYIRPSERLWGYVADIYVDEAARGVGVAEALMAAAEDHCRAKGANHMRLYVLEANEQAQRFYQKSGWDPYERFLRKRL